MIKGIKIKIKWNSKEINIQKYAKTEKDTITGVLSTRKGVSRGNFAQRFLTESPRGCKATHTRSGANPPLSIAPECLCVSPTEQGQKAKVELQSVLRELLVHAGKCIYSVNIRSGKVVDGSGEWPVFISVPTGMWSLLFYSPHLFQLSWEKWLLAWTTFK